MSVFAGFKDLGVKGFKDLGVKGVNCATAAARSAIVTLGFVAVTGAAIISAMPLGAADVNGLAGRWSGWGAVTLSNGATEQVKCVATYFIKEAGAAINQNLRCANASYKIDAKANYSLSGQSVSGSWEELTHSARGEVTGDVTNNGFVVSVKGDTFTAKMVLTASKCDQSISIKPEGLNVDSISIGLKKC